MKTQVRTFILAISVAVFAASFRQLDFFFEPALNWVTVINIVFSGHVISRQKKLSSPGRFCTLLAIAFTCCLVSIIHTVTLPLYIDVILFGVSLLYIVYVFESLIISETMRSVAGNFIPFAAAILIYLFVIKIIILNDYTHAHITGGFKNFGKFSVLTALLSIPVYFKRPAAKAQRIFFTSAILLSFVICIFNFSRLGIIIHSVNFIARIKYLKNNRQKLIAAGLLILAVVAFSLAPSKSNSAEGRFLIIKIMISGFGRNELWAKGFNSFQSKFAYTQANYLHTNSINNFNTASPSYANNEFLQIYFELGIAGLTVLLLFIFFLFKTLRRKYLLEKNPLYAALFLSAFCLLLFSYPLHDPLLMLFLAAITLSSIAPNSKHTAAVKSPTFTKFVLLMPGIASVALIAILTSDQLRWHRLSLNRIAVHNENELIILGKPVYTKNYTESLIYSKQMFGTSREVIRQINTMEKYCINTEHLLQKGIEYEKIRLPDSAEISYLYAARLVPYLIKPKFFLYRLYQNENRSEKADSLRQVIFNQQPKYVTKEYDSIIKNIKKAWILKNK